MINNRIKKEYTQINKDTILTWISIIIFILIASAFNAFLFANDMNGVWRMFLALSVFCLCILAFIAMSEYFIRTVITDYKEFKENKIKRNNPNA